MTYLKLKDPRWQKKRLEILERDEWKCLNCGDTKSTLHIHHKIYFKGFEPWDYHPFYLQTLCESCHEDREDFLKKLACSFQNALTTEEAREMLDEMLAAVTAVGRPRFREELRRIAAIESTATSATQTTKSTRGA